MTDLATIRQSLLLEKAALMAEREANLAATIRVEHELSDCLGTARFFGLNLDFPNVADPASSVME